jgi:hypothetical protein
MSSLENSSGWVTSKEWKVIEFQRLYLIKKLDGKREV